LNQPVKRPVVEEELSSEDNDRGSFESAAPSPVPVVPDPVASTSEEEDDSLSYSNTTLCLSV
jgi:hypothetical protein